MNGSEVHWFFWYTKIALFRCISMKSSGKWHKSFGINTATMGIKMSLALHLILTLGKWYKTQTLDLVHCERRLSYCFLLITAIPRKANVSQPSRTHSTSCGLFLHRPSPPLPSSCQPHCCFCLGLASPGQMAPVQSTTSPLEPHVQCLPWVQQGCSQQNRLVTAPQKLQNPVSLSGHLWGHQEGCSSRNASPLSIQTA